MNKNYNLELELFNAAKNGHVSIIQSLLNIGVNPNVRTICGNTALTLATASNHEYIISELIMNNADVNIENNQGSNALLYAIYNDNPTILLKLLTSGAIIKYNIILEYAKYKKIRCFAILNALDEIIYTQLIEIISFIKLGIMPFKPLPHYIWIPRLLPNTHKKLLEWIINCQNDANTCYIAFYRNTFHKKQLPIQYLLNSPKLISIRNSILSYLLPKQNIMIILYSIKSSFNIPLVSYEFNDSYDSSDSESEYSDYLNYSDYSDSDTNSDDPNPDDYYE